MPIYGKTDAQPEFQGFLRFEQDPLENMWRAWGWVEESVTITEIPFNKLRGT